MSLPAAWVDKIFAKLTLVYGRDFIGRWEGLSMADVKTDWGHELAGFERCPEAIAFALQNLPAGKPPTVLQFRAMANSMPAPEVKALPAPAPDRERLAEELRKLGSIRNANVERVGAKDWARRILGRFQAGERINTATLRFARQALGLEA